MTDDSPYQDAKDARDAVNQAMHKVDDFATHSTSKVLGPLATKTLAACRKLYDRWFGKDPNMETSGVVSRGEISEPKVETDV